MRNYSLAKLELLVLKCAVMEKLWDYLLGSKFTMYMDDNSLAYVRVSKLGPAQIKWLKKLVLFDFDVKYRIGKSNKAVDTLNHHPHVPGEKDSDSDYEECETILDAMVCEELEEIMDGENLPIECKMAIQNKENKPV